ncbi:uncharacterized protein LOC132047692 [Lycium ferocissimum]|uniref:uncharacterized protein LOC132047692 n=1 Tax=Lycium ferocissimum TaxID=112874 RepID=UPI002815FF02|nr:uncharacterized protein LOC132047692 [Lycium ferocissimum]
MERYYHKVSSKRPKLSSTTPDSIDLEEKINESEQHRQNEGIDLSSLPIDPGERLAIRKYHPNDHDAIRRSYIHQGPFQPRKHLFPKRYMYDENINQGGGEVFSSIGFTSWNKKKSFNEHIGGPNNVHNQSRRNAEDLIRQKQSIQSVLAKQSDQQKLEYRTRLEAAIDVIRYLLNQGLSFPGHREDESSFNKGNYIELLRWYTKRCDNIADPFKKAPKNNHLTSPYIQRDIITACKMETVKYIIKDLNDDYFSILVDESRDVSCKSKWLLF